MEIIVRLTPEDLAAAIAQGGINRTATVPMPTPANVANEAPKKRGRPRKDETLAPPEELDDEPTEVEEEFEDEAEDEFEDEAEDEFAVGDELKKIRAALTAYTNAYPDKSKARAATVKILKKFAPNSEKVPSSKVKDLLKALKVSSK